MELKKHQPAMSIDEQVENLKALGLVINDEEYAKSFLNDVSYFRLVKAYSLELKPRNGIYNENVTFEELVELYLFNANLRQLLFAQIERIEINFRCRISNYFSKTYGILGYKNADNFQRSDYHADFLKEIKNEITRNSKSPFVKNFQKHYEGGDLPFYALIELFSFGTLSKFYKNMKNPDKKAVAKIYGVKYTYLESWIENITFVRNICAHYGRLYNVNLSKTPKLYSQYTSEGVSSIRIFATLICIKHLLPRDRHWYEFVDSIELLTEKYSDIKIELMGFPNDWKELLLKKFD